MRVRDAIVAFRDLKSRVGGKLVFLDELTYTRLADFLGEFAQVDVSTVAEEEFINIKENTDLIIVAPPQDTTRYEPLETGTHRVNIIGIGECDNDCITVADGTQFPALIGAIGKLTGVEVISPKGNDAKFIGGPATVIQIKNINLKGC